MHLCFCPIDDRTPSTNPELLTNNGIKWVLCTVVKERSYINMAIMFVNNIQIKLGQLSEIVPLIKLLSFLLIIVKNP
jgi:hypothetical protein